MVKGQPAARQGGFTYLILILAVAMLGAGLGAIGQVWRTVQQRENEKQLLFVGNQFRQAIRRYMEFGPGGRRYPRTLDDLVLDKRFPSIQRHLRKVYRDPMTNSLDWGIVRSPDGGVAGVYSKSELKPLKSLGFAARDVRLEKAPSYREWLFTYEGESPAAGVPRGTPEGAGPGGEPGSMFPGP